MILAIALTNFLTNSLGTMIKITQKDIGRTPFLARLDWLGLRVH
ncbi:hypothetical protein GCM10011538_20560 [Ligilactobacillus murinus]